jgi:WD40 repeat protein
MQATNQYVLIGGLHNALVVNMTTESDPRKIRADNAEWVWGVDLATNQNILITGGNERVLRFWNVHTSNMIDEIKYPNNEFIRFISVDPSNKWLVTSGYSNRGILVWDLDNHKQVYKIDAQLSQFNMIDFDTKGTLIAISSFDGTITVLKIADFSVRYQSQNVDWEFVPSFAFSPDGSKLAVHCLYNHTLQIINLETQQIEINVNLQ